MPCLTLQSALQDMRLLRTRILHRGVNLEPYFKLNDLTNFERSHMLRFPADYRMYLLEIGDGIGTDGHDGPCREGIMPFGKTPFGFPLNFEELLINLRQPFPYEQKRVVEEEDDDDDYEEEGVHSLRNRNVGGYLILGTSTRSYEHYWILVCEGSCRGEVWIVTWQGSFYPCTPRMTFRDWLKDWILCDGYKMEQSLRSTQNYPETPSLEDSDNEDIVDIPFPFWESANRSRERRGAAYFLS